MEARFIEIGKDEANDIRKLNPDVELPADLDDVMANVSWNWFIADMSDSYSVTVKEQDQLKKTLHLKLGDIVYPYRYRKDW